MQLEGGAIIALLMRAIRTGRTEQLRVDLPITCAAFPPTADRI